MKKIFLNSFYVVLFVSLISVVYIFTIPEKSNSFIESKVADSSAVKQYQKDVLAEYQKEVNERVSIELSAIHQSSKTHFLLLEHSIKTYGTYSKEVKNLTETKAVQDSIDLARVEQIIDKYGWLGPERIGSQNSYTLFTVIQNADFTTQEKYLPVMEKAVRSGTLAPEHFAGLIDRKALVQYKKQVFGTFVSGNFNGEYALAPIGEEWQVNERRKEIGLPMLEEYAKTYHINYVLPKKEG